MFAPALRAQDIEPRAYSNAPIGVNFVIAGVAATRGGLSFDPALPIESPSLKTGSAVLGYARVIELWGQSAKVDVIVPYTWLSGDAIYAGQPVERVVDGLTDIAFRLNANLYGAPALGLKEFAAYEQDVIVGASLRVIAPAGAVRQHARREHRQQPLVVQARDRRLQGGRALDAGARCRRHVLHRQRRLQRRQDALAGHIYTVAGAPDPQLRRRASGDR